MSGLSPTASDVVQPVVARKGGRREFVVCPGDVFHRLTVIGSGTKPAHLTVRCSCGTVREVARRKLVSGHTKSCGCRNDEVRQARHLEAVARRVALQSSRVKSTACVRSGYDGVIGYDDTISAQGIMKDKSAPPMLRQLAKLYISICTRTETKTGKTFKIYGERGIGVEPHWLGSGGFLQFACYMAIELGEKPGPGYSIDRIDNDGNYERDNVRWATQKTQCRNTRKNITVLYAGMVMTLAEAAELSGVKYQLLYGKLRKRRGRERRKSKTLKAAIEELGGKWG